MRIIKMYSEKIDRFFHLPNLPTTASEPGGTHQADALLGNLQY